MLTLYEHPLSPYAQKCKIVLLEKGVPYTAKLPAGFGSGTPGDADFVKGNPRHEVPMLVDGELRLFDSTIILEYLEDKFPAPPMLPADPAARARARVIEDVADTYYEAINWGLMELNFFRRAEGELAQTLRARAAEQTEGVRLWLTAKLGDAIWFTGESFGWADAALVPHVVNSAIAGFGPAAGTSLAAWFQRCLARPSVTSVNEAAQGFMKNPPDGKALLAAGFRRQYRDHRLEWMLRSGGLPVLLEGLERKTIRFGNELG
jgi:glutathione S-transferase